MINLDFDETEIVSEMLNEIEKEYGKKIARIPFLNRSIDEPFCLDIKIIFTDYKLLEAKMKVIPFADLASVKIEGTYY